MTRWGNINQKSNYSLFQLFHGDFNPKNENINISNLSNHSSKRNKKDDSFNLSEKLGNLDFENKQEIKKFGDNLMKNHSHNIM